MILSYCNHQIFNLIATKYKVPRELVEDIFKHQVNFTIENMDKECDTRWFGIGTFKYNAIKAQHLTNIKNMSFEERREYRLKIKQKLKQITHG